MKFPKNFELKPLFILKIAGLALVAIIIVTLAFRLIGASFYGHSVNLKTASNVSTGQSAMTFDSKIMPSTARDEGGAAELSVRNVATPTVNSVGDNAEALEVTDYNASIETRSLEETCAKIMALKPRADVVFENANNYEQSCNYSFKVKHDSVAEILNIIKALDPKELNENTYTIKKLLDDYTSEMTILEKKKAAIDDTLTNAVKAYDDIAALATKTKDVESLTKIINNKIEIIEKLTQERININAQLERLDRSKAEQLDRLDYTYFNVNIYENKFVDGQTLKDSWKAAVQSFVRDINSIAQDISINLVALLFWALQYIIYFFILLLIVKYVWKLTRKIWQK
jgi:hypothetical protein